MRSAYARPVTLGLATGLFVISSGAAGTALAATPTPSSTEASATPVASSTAAASPTPAPPTSSAPAASPTPTVKSPSPTADPKPSSTPTKATSPTPSASATPTPTLAPTQTSTPAPTKPRLAVTASASSVQPGSTVLFRISAWSTSAEGGTIATTLTPGAKTPAFSNPVFTVGSCNKTSCALTLPANEPGTPQIEAEVSPHKLKLELQLTPPR